ncbi:succinate dehydrogenase assembly factor 3, mitochondrial [Belonocnema kinseyi]|uniref:succinate dehydrogenase assembly factor 3, mitochondrial n=1 Tax=Belonocnema kinseyi TaxID=2817044 RepID=UPI00143D76E6|nr:succinate dehydrogenase assembly factor 3, mitochondrial [Belonocnema kinseyi]
MNSLSHVQQVRRLYKTILRLHRELPEEVQPLGNNYVRDEFRRHKICTPTEANIFLNEWADYAISLGKQLGLQGIKMAKPLGKNLSTDNLERLRDEQVHQLYELLIATRGGPEDTNMTSS